MSKKTITHLRSEVKQIDGTDFGFPAEKLVMHVRYGFVKIEEQEPYFSITSDVYSLKGKFIIGGALHFMIAKFFPNLATLLKWHLTSQSGLPLHYVDNTLYHLQQDEEHWAELSCVWGVVASDFDKAIHLYSLAELQLYLADRLPELRAAFVRDMDTFRLERI